MRSRPRPWEGGVDAILRQLSKLGYPRFILSSREVDWRGAAHRIKIEDDYGRPAILLHLLAFDRDDATLFLRRNFPSVDAEDVLTHLADRGLEEIYRNPLTLRLIGEVAASDEALPDSRAQLLDRACQLLVQEDNPRHQDAAHAHAEAEKLLLAAGAYAATQLLCDLAELFNGPAGKIPDGCVHVGSLAALLHDEAIDAALGCSKRQAVSVFISCIGSSPSISVRSGSRAVSSPAFQRVGCSHCSARATAYRHRYAGCTPGWPISMTRWRRSVLPLTSMRCCAMGMPRRCPSMSRGLLGALAALSDRDPFFRAEDWGRHPASGLMRTELKDEFLP